MPTSSIWERWMCIGKWRSCQNTVAACGQSPSESQLNLNCDETTAFRSSSLQLWLLLARVAKTFHSPVMTVGFYCRVGKPLNTSDYLKRVMSELTALLAKGTKFCRVCATIYPWCATSKLVLSFDMLNRPLDVMAVINVSSVVSAMINRSCINKKSKKAMSVLFE